MKDLKITKVSAWNEKSPDECMMQWCEEQQTYTSRDLAQEYGWQERNYDEEPIYQLSWKDLFKFY